MERGGDEARRAVKRRTAACGCMERSGYPETHCATTVVADDSMRASGSEEQRSVQQYANDGGTRDDTLQNGCSVVGAGERYLCAVSRAAGSGNEEVELCVFEEALRYGEHRESRLLRRRRTVVERWSVRLI